MQANYIREDKVLEIMELDRALISFPTLESREQPDAAHCTRKSGVCRKASSVCCKIKRDRRTKGLTNGSRTCTEEVMIMRGDVKMK